MVDRGLMFDISQPVSERPATTTVLAASSGCASLFDHVVSVH